MRLSCMRFTVRWLLVVVAVFAGLLWCVILIQRSRHYYIQADFQSKLEANHRRQEQMLRSKPWRSFGSEVAEIEAQEANYHARLKDQYRRLASHPWETAPPELPLPYPWNRDRDRAVLEATLADLMDPKTPDNVLDLPVKNGALPQIIVGETTDSFLPLSTSRQVDEEETWNDLLRRNSGGPVLITGLGLGRNTTVRHDDIDRLVAASDFAGTNLRNYLQTRYPLVCGFVTVTLPGYSRDGRKAIVYIRGGFSPHGEHWECKLECTDLGWKVRSRSHDFSL